MPMKRLLFAGIAFLLLAVLIRFPAASIAPYIARATGDRWRVAAAEGTLWRGQATIYALNGTSGQWYPGLGMKWRVIWSELAKGLFASKIDFDDGGTAQFSLGFRGWSLEQLNAALPAVQVATLLPSALSDYGWSGTLKSQATKFGCNWGVPRCAGQIELSWIAAGTAQIPGPPLGDYRLRMTAEGEALHFDLGTVRGRLQIAGSGELSNGKVRFTGEASANGEDAARLETLLRTIGRPGSAPGRYLIEYRETQDAR